MGNKVTIEIEDTLQDRIDSACSDVEELLRRYLIENPDTERCPDLGDLDYSGSVHEIIDGSVPIYTKEINDTWILHGEECEEAFENAGIGDKDDKNWPMGWKPAAIYCYIEQAVAEWYDQASADIFEEWQVKQNVG